MIIQAIPNHDKYCKIIKNTKKPIGENWQKKPFSFEKIKSGLEEGRHGYGIIFGENFSGIDIDNTQARDRFKKHFGYYPNEYAQSNNLISWCSGKNFDGDYQEEINEQSCLTILFANTHQDWELLKGRKTAKNNTFDIRTGNCQSVLPSYSLHPQTKQPYRWICSPNNGATAGSWGNILPPLLDEISDENYETGKLSSVELSKVLEHKQRSYEAWQQAQAQKLNFIFSPSEFMEFVIEPMLLPLHLFDDTRHNFNQVPYHGSNPYKGNPFYRQSSSGKSFILFRKQGVVGPRWFFNDTADEELKGTALYYRWRIVLGKNGYPNIDEQWEIVEYYAQKANVKLPSKRQRKLPLGILLVDRSYQLKVDMKPPEIVRVLYSGEDIKSMTDDELISVATEGIEIAVDDHDDFNSIAKRLFELEVTTDIVDGSKQGLGKTHRTAHTNPEDFDVEFIRYISPVFHLNPTDDMKGWDAETSRHGGTFEYLFGDIARKRRTKHNEPYKTEKSNCIRAGAMQHFQELGVPIPMESWEDKNGKTKIRSALCTGCPMLESCSYLYEKTSSFKYKRSRIHPNSLIDNSQDEPKKGTFHPTKALAVIDEIETLDLTITNNYSLKHLDLAIAELRRHEMRKNIEPIPFEIYQYLTELSLYLLDEKIGKYGISNNNELFKIGENLPEYDTELLRKHIDTYRTLLNELPDLLDTEEIKDELDKENKIAQNIVKSPKLSNIFYNFIPDLLDILSKKMEGAICITRNEKGRCLSVTKPNQRLINNLKAFKYRIYLDATADIKYLAKALKTNEKGIVKMSVQPKTAGANLEIIQISGVGRMTKERSENQEQITDAICNRINNIYGAKNVGTIDYKKFIGDKSNSMAWVTGSRGSNEFQNKKVLIIKGLLCPNLNALVNEYVTLTGRMPVDEGKIVEVPIIATNLEDGIQAFWRGYESDDIELREFIRHKILAEAHQAIGRLRANRRDGEDLKCYILCDYPLDIPVTLISAGEFCPEAMDKKERKATQIFEGILEIHKKLPNGIKLTQDIIAEHLSIPKSTVNDYISDLLKKNLPLWLNRKYSNVYELIVNHYKHLYRGVIPEPKSEAELKILQEQAKQTIHIDFNDLMKEVQEKWLNCTTIADLQAIDDEYAYIPNWKEEKNAIWKLLTKAQKNQIQSVIGTKENMNYESVGDLFDADNARLATERVGDRVECNEDKLNIFSSTKLPIPEYKPSNIFKPYDEIRKLYLDIETLGLDAKKDRIIMIGIKDEKGNYHTFWNVDEKLMIENALDFIKGYKPEILTGYNLINFDIPFIIERCNHHNIPNIFKVGNKETKCAGALVFGKQLYYRPVYIDNCCVIDAYHLVLQFDNVARKLSKHDLKTATIEMRLRDDRRLELNHNQIAEAWKEGNFNIIEEYLKFDLDDTELLTNQLLPPIYYQKQFLPKVSTSDLVRLGTGTKWQMILNNLYDDRNSPEADEKLSYEGGLTFANYGLFRHCAKIDVGSLYPSIMLKYGICSRKDNHRKMLGVLKFLTNERLRLKALAKQGDKEADYKQGSMKILINSAYGLLGVGGLGYNDISASALVTAYGRNILKFMLSEIESEGGVMVECDTDGIIFSHDNPQEVHTKLQEKLPEGINIDLEWVANGVYVPSDGNGKGLKKNYIIFKGGDDIKFKGKYRKREIPQIEREFPVEYLRLYLINPSQADDYYRNLKQEILGGNYPIEKLSQTRKIKSNEKQLSHLGNQGDVITFWEGNKGKTSTISDGYNAYYYLSIIDDILLRIKEDLNLVNNADIEEVEQMSLL